jgi:hypothetical protein
MGVNMNVFMSVIMGMIVVVMVLVIVMVVVIVGIARIGMATAIMVVVMVVRGSRRHGTGHLPHADRPDHDGDQEGNAAPAHIWMKGRVEDQPQHVRPR